MSVSYIPGGGKILPSRTTKGPTSDPLPVTIVPPGGTIEDPEKKPAQKPAKKPTKKQDAKPAATEPAGETKKEVAT